MIWASCLQAMQGSISTGMRSPNTKKSQTIPMFVYWCEQKEVDNYK